MRLLKPGTWSDAFVPPLNGFIIAVSTLLVLLSLPDQTRGGYEPFAVDVTQSVPVPAIDDIGHLVPLKRVLHEIHHWPPEFPYLAQYWADIPQVGTHYVVVARDTQRNEYFVAIGDPPKGGLDNHAYRSKEKVRISPDTAEVIYELWANVLLQTSYPRQSSPMLIGAPLYLFSTFVNGVGYLHGQAVSAEQYDVPPRWIVQAGESLFQFVSKKDRDESALRENIRLQRDKCYGYFKDHYCH